MTAIAASLAFALPAFADHDHHSEQGHGAKTAPGKPAANAAATVQKMQENVKKMQAQFERVAAAKTDEERHNAMSEYMRTMHENVKLARGMKAGKMHCPMMGRGMMGGGA